MDLQPAKGSGVNRLGTPWEILDLYPHWQTPTLAEEIWNKGWIRLHCDLCRWHYSLIRSIPIWTCNRNNTLSSEISTMCHTFIWAAKAEHPKWQHLTLWAAIYTLKAEHPNEWTTKELGSTGTRFYPCGFPDGMLQNGPSNPVPPHCTMIPPAEKQCIKGRSGTHNKPS